MTERCGDCKFFDMCGDGPMGDCWRYPNVATKNRIDKCGEFRPRDEPADRAPERERMWVAEADTGVYEDRCYVVVDKDHPNAELWERVDGGQGDE